MKPAAFRYIRPDSVAETVGVLREHGDGARILAGGQSLGAMLNMRLATPAILVDTLAIADIRRIHSDEATVSIGATVTQAAALASPLVRERVPLLARALPHVGHFQTRNRGTVGGSVAHCDPSAEIPLALRVLGGAVVLKGGSGVRQVAAADFFRGALTTSRRADEMIVETRWPSGKGRTGVSFQEVAIREGDFAIAACACVLTLAGDDGIERLQIGYAGVGDRPLLADCAGFAGAPASRISRADIENLTVPDLRLRDDLHAGAEYRRHLMKLLGWRAFSEALQEAGGRIHA
ncbi:MAG: xanthine dehydrogenase family protein subunit M [Flavobacteriaceae bacterium]